jgi:hypothetical protein
LYSNYCATCWTVHHSPHCSQNALY